MEVPTQITMYFSENTPSFLYPVVALVMGLIHLFPLCCTTAFVLGEIGHNLQDRLFSNWPLIFQQLESDYYDENRMMHLCRFHALLGERVQDIPYEKRSRYHKWLGRRTGLQI